MRKTTKFSRTPFAISLVMICGYNMFVTLTQPTAEGTDIPEIMISGDDQAAPLSPVTALATHDLERDEADAASAEPSTMIQ